MDKLEQFIKDNREDLDRYEPSPLAWKKIRAGLPSSFRVIPSWVSAAAMITVILGTAFLIYSSLNSKNPDYSEGNAGQSALKETEIYYNALVNSIYSQAKPLLTGQPEIANELRTDMSHLDSIGADIRKDLKDNVANQEVVEALIQNYRIKLRLLEDMLVILKQNEDQKEKTKSHEL
jgi:CHASE3 domain sensor protein